MDDDEKKLQDKLEAALKSAAAPDAARNLMALLFPKVGRLLETDVSGSLSDSEQWDQRRIFQRDFASTYFRLDPQPVSWGRSELATILSNPNPTDALSLAQARIDSAVERERPRLLRLFLNSLIGAFGP